MFQMLIDVTKKRFYSRLIAIVSTIYHSLTMCQALFHSTLTTVLLGKCIITSILQLGILMLRKVSDFQSKQWRHHSNRFDSKVVPGNHMHVLHDSSSLPVPSCLSSAIEII